jgi:hypothetical protein
MPPVTSILNISGFEVEDISGLDPLIIKVKYTPQIQCRRRPWLNDVRTALSALLW